MDTVSLRALNRHGFVEIKGPRMERSAFGAAACDMLLCSDLGSRLLHEKGDKSVPESPDCVSFIPGVGAAPQRRGEGRNRWETLLPEPPGVRWTGAAVQAVSGLSSCRDQAAHLAAHFPAGVA